MDDFLWIDESWPGAEAAFWLLSQLELRRGSGANEMLDFRADESSPSLARTLVLDPSTVLESGK